VRGEHDDEIDVIARNGAENKTTIHTPLTFPE
jgi:hypothetical protein